jgi:CheY-like chemotaxis protein
MHLLQPEARCLMSDVPKPLLGCRILVVEDEYFIAEILEGWLREAGAVVIGPVPSVKRALELIQEEGAALDAAVLDVNLGRGETAYPIAARLNEIGVPYLFATGDVRIIDDPMHRERPRLAKPIATAHLLRTLEQLLAARSSPADEPSQQSS